MFKVSTLIIFCEKYDYGNHSLLKYEFVKVDDATTTTWQADCIWLHNDWEEQWLATG